MLCYQQLVFQGFEQVFKVFISTLLQLTSCSGGNDDNDSAVG